MITLSPSKIRFFAIIGVIMFILLVIFEIGAKIAVSQLLNIRSGDFQQYYKEDPKYKILAWARNFESHPYFGYMHPRMKRLEQFQRDKTKNQFIIGILGGSVAEHFAHHFIQRPEYADRLKNGVPGLADKDILIFNLAAGGYKQPQQFFIASYFVDKVDLFINIDGFNEVLTNSLFSLVPAFPLDYPLLSTRFYSRSDKGSVFKKLAGLSRYLYKKLNAIPRRVSLIGKSNLYFLAWYGGHDLLYRTARRFEQIYYSSLVENDGTPSVEEGPNNQIRHDNLNLWKRYTKLQADLLRNRRKPAFFFLQPNQYLKGSKILSDHEKKTAINNDLIEQSHAAMMLLKAGLEDLERSGIPAFDLTGVYSDTKETVYTDDCCHVNNLGNELMAEEVLAVIKEESRQNMVALQRF